MPPIFIGWTRSFWFGILPLLLIGLNLLAALSSEAGIGPLAALIGLMTGADAGNVEIILRGASVAAGLIVAHQRGGAARPYTLDPRARK